MKQRFRILIELDKETRQFATYVPELDGVSTFGATCELALEHTEDLIRQWLADSRERGIVPQRVEDGDLPAGLYSDGPPEAVFLEVNLPWPSGESLRIGS